MDRVVMPAYAPDAATLALREGTDIVSLEETIAKKRAFFAFKRIADIVLAILAIIVLIPLFIVVAIAIAIDDGFPILFQQVRIGKDGKLFRILKFRSMYRNAAEMHESLLAQNEADGPAFKIKRDPRMTRVGRFIRKVCIDELPQLVNVIKGDMSIVGPRPLVVKEAYACTGRQAQRQLVRPGLTCLWQVMPKRNGVPFDEWMQSDLDYIRTCGVLLDILIIAKTFKAVFHAEGW